MAKLVTRGRGLRGRDHQDSGGTARYTLNESVAISRSTPGPVGLYIVSVGYLIAGVPGAIAGWLAMITPALLSVNSHW